MNSLSTLKAGQKSYLLVISFIVVAFGQPVWSEKLALVAAIGGFACFWRAILDISNPNKRFCIAMGWYAAVQIVQLSWFPSHPYAYIYGVMLLCAWLMGAQWGIIAIWITPQTFSQASRLSALAGLWAILEWSRLFILSGLPFNPVGLTLSSSIYSLQLASIGGIYGLSFWVILTNFFVLRAWLQPRLQLNWVIVCLLILFPYGFGWNQLYVRHLDSLRNPKTLSVVLIQSALPIEEKLSFQSAEEVRAFVLNEWYQVLSTLTKQVGQTIDLIVMPENLVPYGAHYHVFPIEDIRSLFQKLFGDISYAFPNFESPHIRQFKTDQGLSVFVSNAFLAQTIANFFQAHVVIGLEDSVYMNQHKVESYSSAFHFIPKINQLPKRYDKRILVPMGEYIPFAWCRQIAAKYGIMGSLTCGQCAKVFEGPVPFGASICYEEMYGHLMRENRLLGAELLVNLTNDGWYPRSHLPKQHFDHSRLRTVENGIPLIRSCNTGITGAIDSLGRVIGVLGEKHMQIQEIADSIQLNIPLFHYHTFYTRYGDFSILALSCLLIILPLGRVFPRYLKAKHQYICSMLKIKQF